MKRISVVIALGLLSALSSCGSEQVEEPFVRPVRSTVIQAGGSDAAREFSGIAQTDRVVDLSFRSNGIITKFNIALGQQVSKGDVLAELDNVSARLAYEQARASLNSAKSSYDTQNLALQRVRDLYEKGGSSLSDYEAAKNQFRTAKANYRSAQRSVDLQQEQIRYGEIVAPEDGVIAAVNNDINENVSAGQTVAVLNAGTEMEIEVGLPESIINLVKADTEVAIRFSALADRSYQGRVKEISPSLDQQSATYPVRVSIADADEQVRAGMAATVAFKLGVNTSNSIYVPAAAVGEDDQGNFVFVLQSQDENTAVVKKQPVTLGNLVNADFEISTGLITGDRIVTAGVHSVIDGQLVKLSND